MLIQVSSLEGETHDLEERNTSSLTSLQGECDQHTACTGVVDGYLHVHAFTPLLSCVHTCMHSRVIRLVASVCVCMCAKKFGSILLMETGEGFRKIVLQ